ncbi:MAG: PAS domain S-box protein [Candidatus Cloacimonetes bacterium]|nr:PAS domain S-box protein [Candidatus Cloacimonadota bacterium]
MLKLKILMLEDNQLDAEMIKAELKDQKFDCVCKVVASKRDFIKSITEFKPDLILSDYNLPQFTGFEALEIAKETIPLTPFIIVTGALSEETAADSIIKGVWDYVVKDRLVRLGSAINHSLRLQKEKLLIVKAEKALKENAQKLNLIIDQSPIGVSTTNMEGKFLSANKAFCKMLGYSEKEITQKKFHDITHPDDIDKNINYNKDLISQKIPSFDMLKRFIKKNGEVIYVSLRSQLVVDEDGKPLFEIGITEDITNRLKARTDLIRSEKRLNVIFRNALDVILVVDEKSGEILDANKALFNVLAYKKASILGQNLILLFPNDSNEEKNLTLKKLTTKNDVIELHDIKRKDGSLCPMDISTTKIPWGEKKALLVNLRDVTKRRKAEIKIQQNLKEKEIMLMEIHHRVKNNLQIISSMLKMQSAYIKDKDSLHYFKDSQSRVKTMSLIHESLYQSEDLTHVNLDEYISKLIRQLQISFGSKKKDIKITTKIANIHWNINKTIPLGLLINEIVTNAYKFAFEDKTCGEIKILLNCQDDCCVLNITDNGISMPEEIDIKDSSSLGLNLIQALVSQLHGTMEFSRNKGTSYRIEFKL